MKAHPVSALFASLLVWGLAVGVPAVAWPLPSPCAGSTSHIELPTEPGADVSAVCIRPDAVTAFVFDSEVLAKGVKVQERGRFVDVALGEHSVTVLPPLDALPGERFRLEVRFADGAAPESAVFELVVHPVWAAHQVKVSRHPRTLKDYQEETKEKDVRLQRCEASLEHLQQQGPGPGLAGLLAAGVMAPNNKGVLAQDVSSTKGLSPGNALPIMGSFSYRATPPVVDGQASMLWVAVAVELKNPGTEPWTPGGAALTPPGQEPRALRLWPLTPVAPGETSHWVTVETQLPTGDAPGPHRLTLWDESGGRPISLEGVTFP